MTTPTSLAAVFEQLVQAVRADVDLDFDARVSAVIGNPEQVDDIDPRNDHYLNFFFYQFEPFEFDADTRPRQPLMLRTHCLITPFAIQESDEASAGFNDLKLVGELLRIFHQTPVRELTVTDSDDQPATYLLQTVFQPLGPEQINNLWTTQGGDVAYRPSVAYEVSLAPVLPSEKDTGSPLVGALGLDVHADMDKVDAPASGVVSAPVVVRRTVNTRTENWEPRVCLVYSDACIESASFALGSAELAAFVPTVWVVGDAGTEVRFVWDVWESSVGWTTVDASETAIIAGDTIDPDAIDTGSLVALSIPLDGGGQPILSRTGQAVLYARRTYVRGSDSATVEVRSNPLLISVFEAGSPP